MNNGQGYQRHLTGTFSRETPNLVDLLGNPEMLRSYSPEISIKLYISILVIEMGNPRGKTLIDDADEFYYEKNLEEEDTMLDSQTTQDYPDDHLDDIIKEVDEDYEPDSKLDENNVLSYTIYIYIYIILYST